MRGRIEYIEIDRDELAKTIEISEEALAAYYEIEKARFLEDERRQARHILILFDDDEDAAEAKANELLAQIQGGASFEELAAENSMDGGTASNGGDLGALTQTQLPDALGDAIFDNPSEQPKNEETGIGTVVGSDEGRALG